MSTNSLKEDDEKKRPAAGVCGENIATSTNVSISIVKPGEDIQKTLSALETPPSSPPSNSYFSLFSGSLLSRSFGRQRTVSEGGAGVSVNVDLSPWLKDGNNIRAVKEARVRRNSNREAEEAMACGLSKADIHMPPI